MRVVVIGATGNVGTSLLPFLANDPDVDEIVGVARRAPELHLDKTSWVTADIGVDDLTPILAGADAVVHLAWLIQPSHTQSLLRRTNVMGTERVLRAVAKTGVARFVYASSIGAYAPGPSDGHRVTEDWPTTGIITSYYSRQKAAVERMLNTFEAESPAVRVVRLRPGLIFKREAASEIRRLFLGPLMPNRLLKAGRIPVMPSIEKLEFQAVHSLDVGRAYWKAVKNDDAAGAFNIAAEPTLDTDRVARLLNARTSPVAPEVVRKGMDATWKLHLQPARSGWFDMGMQTPLMNYTRAREVLGWQPEWRADDALRDLLDGLAHGAGAPTPPLWPDDGAWQRVREIAGGAGGWRG
ncbi:MAG TPA: NAD-dependent epimerase/dehydratase family protein [Actinomycetota bacterium]|nr:NAD-dependent epimerase/dehydratase family protein [Actinomycetota bacterium]